MIRLLVLDLDGTLLNNAKKISARNRDTLLQAEHECGLRIAIGSGRQVSFAAAVAAPLQLAQNRGFIIGCNGQTILDCGSGELIREAGISAEVCQRVLSYGAAHHLEAHFARGDEKIVLGRDGSGTAEIGRRLAALGNLDKAVLFTAAESDAEWDHAWLQQAQQAAGGTVDAYLVAPHVIDFVAAGISKVTGVQRVMSKMGIAREEVLVMGDGENDLPCALAFPFCAMANAMPPVKEAADRITLDNESDGVAFEVERSILHACSSE